MASTVRTNNREHWLDSLRGIAAAIVAWFHFTVGEMGPPYRPFWANPRGKIDVGISCLRSVSFLQASLWYFCFFCNPRICGVDLYYRLREAAPMHFYWKLTSSVLRRGFRFYIPVLITCLLSHVAFFIEPIDWNPGNPTEVFPEAEPWSALRSHLGCLIMTFLTTLDLTGSLQVTGYNCHLWTISFELRCSLSVCLVILGLASAKPRVRLNAIDCLGAIFMWFGSPIISAFLASLMFAELDVAKQESFDVSTSVIKQYQTLGTTCLNLLLGLLSGIGIFLICLPQDPNFSLEFWFQSHLALPFYVDPQIRI